MTAFRAERRTIAAALTALVLSAPALAQAPQPLGPPRPLTERVAPAPSAAEPGPANASGVKRAVEIDTLGAIDPDSIGLIDAAGGGFDATLWRGSNRQQVARLMARLPSTTASRSMRELMRRLLLSTATVPQGEAAGESLLALRIARLMAMGDVGAAAALLRIAPGQSTDGAMALAEVESLFFGNDNAGACNRVRAQAERVSGRYWQQATAYCLTLAAEHDKAALLTDMLRETADNSDPVFFKAMEALGGNRSTAVASLPDPKALTLSMLRAANLELAADVVVSDQPAVLRTVALSPNAPLRLRLEAAERASSLGALTPEALAEIYAGLTFTPAEIKDPLAAASADWGPKGRALLLRAVRAHAEPVAKAQALQQGWKIARERGGLDTMLRVGVMDLATIAPAPELVWFALDAARALYGAGRSAAAGAWVTLVRDRAAENAEAQSAWRALWPLAALAGGTDVTAADGAPLATWWTEASAKGAKEAAAKALTLYSALEALGVAIADERWSALLDSPYQPAGVAPSAAVTRMIAAAAAAGRVGETVLLALIALGPDGPAGAQPAALATAIGALRAVGLEKDARSLALEAALASGV